MNKITMVVLGIVIVAAFAWRIMNPPKPPIPGPIGNPSRWSSSSTVGKFVDMDVSAEGKIATVWHDEKHGSGVRLFTADLKQVSSVELADSVVRSVTFVDDEVRVALSTGNKLRICRVNEGVEEASSYPIDVDHVLAWSKEGNNLLYTIAAKPNVVSLLDTTSSVTFDVELPKDVAVDLSDVDQVSENAQAIISTRNTNDVSGLPHYYFINFKSNKAKLVDAAMPGRVQYVYLSNDKAIFVCNIRDKMQTLLYDNNIGKVSSPAGPIDSTLADTYYFTTDAAVSYSPSTAIFTKVFDYKQVTSSDDYWKAVVPGNRGYLLPAGDMLSVNTDGQEPDIRVFVKSSDNKYQVRPVLPR